MSAYLMETSKYFIGILMILYLVFTYLPGNMKNPNSIAGKISHIFCMILVILIHTISFLTLYFEKNNIAYLFMGLVEVIILFAVLVLFQYIYPELDKVLLNHMCLLMSIGFIILLRISPTKAVRQLKIIIVSIIIALMIPYVVQKLRILRYIKWVYAMLGLFGLLAVLIMGAVTNGSKISYSILGFTFQPSEFVKLLFLFFCAAMLSNSEKNQTWKIIMTSLIAGLHIIILVLSKDLGAALIFFVVFLFILFLYTENFIILIGGIFTGVVGAFIGSLLFDHVRQRIEIWMNPWSDLTGSGYQITQSLFAIGTGGWFGLGLTRGRPDSIPFVETDFVFSAIAEEMGVIFAVGILLVFLSCFIRIMYQSYQMKDSFYRLITSGIGIMLIFQVFLTVGGGSKLIPLTGVTLPMISYGGSSILTTILLFGLAQGSYLIDDTEASVVKRKNVPYYITLGVFSLSILVLSFYIVGFSYRDREQLVSNAYNPRQEIIEQQTTRGSILASNGEVLAKTEKTDAGLEVRVYPYDNLFAHVVGYDTNGKMGLEKLYHYKLITSDISIADKVENAVTGKKNPGNTIKTTLNVAIQETASKALGIYKGAIIVTEPDTGKVLAMVSKPDFNPNEISLIWESLLEDDESGMLLNRNLQGLYPPGSTFKIVTALEYLIEHNDTYQDYSYQCNGIFRAGDESIQCYHKTSHGNVTLKTSFAKSCNSSFANIGTTISKETLKNTLTELLFDEKLPFEMDASISTTGLDSSYTESDMIQLSIGQGKTLITPLHLSMITNAIANNGVLMKPYLLEQISSEDGSTISNIKPQKYGQLMQIQEADILKEFMRSVVEEGTATKLNGLDYSAAGKTGSAEYNGIKEDSHAWFTGFAPADQPRVAVTIIVEGAGSGGDYAVPIAKRIFDTYFKEYGNASDTDLTETE